MKIQNLISLMGIKSKRETKRKGLTPIKRKIIYRNGKVFYISPFEHYMGKILPYILIGGVCFFVWVAMRLLFGF